ncbi:uncharacterized protein LOC116253284 [Nymphaea colorata]|nr:uncharacterized protein LOC116253284 [Nymphaea colorata]
MGKRRTAKEIALEEYGSFQAKPDDGHNLTADLLNQIVAMHGFCRIHQPKLCRSFVSRHHGRDYGGVPIDDTVTLASLFSFLLLCLQTDADREGVIFGSTELVSWKSLTTRPPLSSRKSAYSKHFSGNVRCSSRPSSMREIKLWLLRLKKNLHINVVVFAKMKGKNVNS